MGKKVNWLVVCTGAVVGLAALLLTRLGNPGNMGFCIACFLRDISGALGLHSAAKVQYIRPEIIGLVLGAAVMALAGGEFKARAGSAPALRFLLGGIVMVGALAFLGCPLRMVLRLGGGDVTAIAGLLGFVAGILAGVVCLKKGFSLGRAYKVKKAEGFVLPGIMVGLLLLLLVVPGVLKFSQEGPGASRAFWAVALCAGLVCGALALPGIMVGLLLLLLVVPGVLKFSQEGPGASRAFWAVALCAGLVCGALAQKSRLCMAGGIRDAVLFRDFHLLTGFAAIFLVVLAGSLLGGTFRPGLEVQPVAHHDYLWSFLGMAAAGWGSILLGGCPLRQLILAGEGNGDSAVTVLGMMAGAALSHNFGMAGNADAMADGVFAPGGVGMAGRIGVVICLILLGAISLANLHKEEKRV